MKEKLVGKYGLQDFLHIKDFSEQLGKEHQVKVEYTKGETAEKLLKDYGYQDIGVREINEWLTQSAVGERKVLFLAYIERLTPSAANALLKSCEEPLPGRIIIATTASVESVMETLISRASLIRF